MVRSPVEQVWSTDGRPKLLLPPVLRRARVAACDVSFELDGIDRVELAVEHAVQERCHICTAHAPRSFSWYFTHAFCSRPRARASRDMTVPIGAPVISAIC